MASLDQIFIANFKKVLGNRTAYWIAKESGISQTTALRILKGEMHPSLESIESIARGLGVDAFELLIPDTPAKSGIPSDILNLLDDQPDIVYDAVRAILAALPKKKKRS